MAALQSLAADIEERYLSGSLPPKPEPDPLADYHQGIREQKEEEWRSNFDPDNARHRSLLDLGDALKRGFEEYRNTHRYQPAPHRDSVRAAIAQLQAQGFVDYPQFNFRIDLMKGSALLRKEGDFMAADRVESYVNDLDGFSL